MVKIYFFTFILGVFLIGDLGAQAPVMNPITGATAVCSAPSAANSYSASASNSPTSYSWSVLPSAGVVIGTPSNSTTTIDFPYTGGSYTIVCYATNGSGTSSPVTFVVNVFETPNVTFSGATSFCQGSSTNISASSTMLSASPTVNYFWSPPTGLNTTVGPNVSASPTTNTTYTVLATYGSCSSTGTITITPLPTPTLSASFTNSVVCSGDLTTLNVSGALSYTVSPAAPFATPYNVFATTTYTINGTNGFGCSSKIYPTVFVNPPPVINVSANPPMACAGQSVAISFSGTSTSYSFNSVPSGNSVAVTPTVATTYTISGVTSLGCKGSTSFTVFIGCVGIYTPVFAQPVGLSVYPNPSNGQFILNSGNDESVRIVNELGQLIRTVDLKPNTETKVEGLNPGVYFVLSNHTRIKIVVLQ